MAASRWGVDSLGAVVAMDPRYQRGRAFRLRRYRFLEGARDSALACKLRFLETPHVHHCDSMMLFEETDA
jgi:hypothetical protein